MLSNRELAERLTEVAELLEVDPHPNRFRIAAYRNAARQLTLLDRPAAEVLATQGREGLDELPGIGQGLASTIEELVRTEHLGLLDRLRERHHCEDVFATLPGVGPVLAARVHRNLGVETLPELEQAAHEGRLREVPGIGPTLDRHIREALQVRLRWRSPPVEGQPPVSEILDVDREYRAKGVGGLLRLIAPRRFNPQHLAWLPILNTRRGEWLYTALFCNTELAHDLGKTGDWVILYYAKPGEPERQATVVTETHGPRRGCRVVRGRELE